MRESKFFYPALISIIWFVTYIACSFFLDYHFEWDECKYLATARGIAENFDFGSRSTTVEGLLRYGFPQHTTHYPLNSIYIALFFKLLGPSLNVAYFSTWFSALITCIFLYLTLLIVTENRKFFSFLLAISFLFFPSNIFNINSVMMEIPGCALVSFLVFLVFKSISEGKSNSFLLGIAGVWLYLYKSLFIGVIFGFIGLIFLSYNSKFMDIEIKKKPPLYLSLILYLAIFSILYFIFTKFVFLPLGPWLVFDQKQIDTGTYADMTGGFFNDVFGNLKLRIIAFIYTVVFHYYPFPVAFMPNDEALYVTSPPWVEFGVYFLTFFYVIVLSVMSWRKINPIQRMFILFTLISIITFNLILIVLTGGNVGPFSRYNLFYVPMLVVSFGIILLTYFPYFKPFFLEHKKGSCFIILSLFVLIFIPIYYSAIVVMKWDDKFYYNHANKNSNIIKKFINNSNPMFVYFTGGSHITWDSFPTREVFMEATNEKIKKINSILPKPIEYLFLNPTNNLFKQNQDLILKFQPIINNWYTFYGADPANQIVIYKLAGELNSKK